MANDHYPPYTPTHPTESIDERCQPYNTPSSIRQPSITTGYAPEARYSLSSGPPDANIDSSPVYSGYKRPASQALYHRSHVGTHSAIGQSEGWYAANPSKHPRLESSLPVYPSRPGQPDLKEMSTNAYANVIDTPTFTLRSVLCEKELTGPNFLDWERNLRIVLRSESKLYTLEHPVPDHPPVNAPQGAIDAYNKHSDDSRDVTGLMLLTMCPNLQERFMEVKVDAFNMIRLLQKMFQQYLIEQYETSQALYSCKMVEGGSVSAHFMKMKRYIDYRERLGYPVAKELATDIILNSLSKDYKEFVINFGLNNMELPFSELHEMLKDYEQRLSLNTKYKEVVMVRQGRENNNFDKGNSKIPAKKTNTKLNPKPKTKTKSKTEPPKPKVHPATDDVCHHCKEIGHWRRNCPKYLRELMDKKADMAKMS
ncbi:zinc finger, CCHC-type containing protein [Tanacetum coccineum]